MKVDLIRKYKWYIVGLIVAWILMAIGLSFCSWDSNSIANSIDGDIANFGVNYGIAEDKNDNGVADVGDIINFGKYYQSAEATAQNPIKAPIRWIVVHREGNELTLLSEKVLAFGNFWNRYYHNGNDWVWEDSSFQQYYQNYMVSTLSMWLNSDYSARHDQGIAFSANAEKLAMRGFMNEAFTSDEIKYINDRTISDMQGCVQNSTTRETYISKTYKVWIPSWSEIYGTRQTPWGETLDGSPNRQFEYFSGIVYDNTNLSLIGQATDFAATPSKSNYTTSADTSSRRNTSIIASANDSRSLWWLRSPNGLQYAQVLMIGHDGSPGSANSSNSIGGVRPAICINA